MHPYSYKPAELETKAPEFFTKFLEAMVGTDEGQQRAKKLNLAISTTAKKMYRIEGVETAASKWRLAKSVNGIEVEGYKDHTIKAYVSQFKVYLSVVAFERYADMFGAKWYEMDSETFTPNKDLASRIRTALTKKEFELFRKGANMGKLPDKFDAFRDGDDANLVPFFVAVRNGFAHGTLAAQSNFEAFGEEIREYVLSGIQTHASELICGLPIREFEPEF